MSIFLLSPINRNTLILYISQVWLGRKQYVLQRERSYIHSLSLPCGAGEIFVVVLFCFSSSIICYEEIMENPICPLTPTLQSPPSSVFHGEGKIWFAISDNRALTDTVTLQRDAAVSKSTGCGFRCVLKHPISRYLLIQ